MEEEIRNALKEIDPKFGDYKGNNLIEDMGIDSHDIFNLVVCLEDAFDIKIPPTALRLENFTSVEKIMSMLKEIVQ